MSIVVLSMLTFINNTKDVTLKGVMIMNNVLITVIVMSRVLLVSTIFVTTFCLLGLALYEPRPYHIVPTDTAAIYGLVNSVSIALLVLTYKLNINNN